MKKNLHKLVITLLILFTHYNISAQLFLDFENASKGGYATAIRNIEGYDWEFTESLVGALIGDKMEGERSLRFSGKTDSQFTQISEKENGIGAISFLYKSYPGDNQSEWIVQYTIDDGNTWIQVGDQLDNEKMMKTLRHLMPM